MLIASSISKVFVLSINGVTSGHYEVSKCLLASLYYPGNVKRYIIIWRKYNHLIGRFNWFIALITEGALRTKIKFPILSDVYCYQYLYDLKVQYFTRNTWRCQRWWLEAVNWRRAANTMAKRKQKTNDDPQGPIQKTKD